MTVSVVACQAGVLTVGHNVRSPYLGVAQGGVVKEDAEEHEACGDRGVRQCEATRNALHGTAGLLQRRTCDLRHRNQAHMPSQASRSVPTQRNGFLPCEGWKAEVKLL